MSESANNMIPAEIREQFPQDEQGRVLFFTTPPVDTQHIIQGRTNAEKGDQLAHSLRYLAVKADREREREKAARKRQLHTTDGTEMENERIAESKKRVKAGFFAADGEQRDADGRIRADPDKAQQIAVAQKQRLELLKTRALATLVRQLDQGTDSFYKAEYGEKAEEYKAIDALKQQELVKLNQRAKGHKNTSVAVDAVVDFKRSPWKTGFKDDYDARY
jgi:chromatin structure-remodeling complex subunit RSC1/2